jgi:hypothetical protein
MRLVQTTKQIVVGHHKRYKNNLFDLDIKDQGHSGIILILDTPLCYNT